MTADRNLISLAFKDLHMQEAIYMGLSYIATNPDNSALLEGKNPNEVYVQACLMPALNYHDAQQDPKKEALVYFFAYPALEHMPRKEVCQKFGDAVADLNEEIKLYTLEIEGEIPADRNRALSATAKCILNAFARTANPEADSGEDAFRTLAYTSQLSLSTPAGKPS